LPLINPTFSVPPRRDLVATESYNIMREVGAKMKWKQIGDIIVLNRNVENPEKYLKMKGVKTVVKIERIKGRIRRPEVKVLAGADTENNTQENKCLFKLDVATIMWSKGNTYERMRIPRLIEDGETIVDMFAGIGYFSIPIAVHANPKKVYAIEINPKAYHYLKENMKLNKVQDKIRPILGDSRIIAPKLSADRVLMGYVVNTHHYLDAALKCLKEGGILHYHETAPEKIKFKRPIKRVKKAAKPREVKILNKRIIKKYSPGVWHVVIDAKID